MSEADFLRHRERLRAWLLGKEYYKAVEALEYAARFHTGVRKDGITKEFMHQLAIGHYLRTLPGIRQQEKVLSVAFLHDLLEDHNVPVEILKEKFGSEVVEAVVLLSKKVDNKKKAIELYFSEIGGNPIASIVKGGDRIHNHQTLGNVFTCKKQKEYIQETEEFILPMLRDARNNFPDQELAYENIKHALKGQIELLRLSIEAKTQLEQLTSKEV